MSYLVKIDSWQLSKALKNTYSKELLKKISKKLLANTCVLLSRRNSKKLRERFNNITFEKNVPVIWMQLLKNNDIIHVNQLEKFYQLYILDNGALIKSPNSKDEPEIHEKLSENRFIIIISSFAADVINVVSGFNGDDTEKLYAMVWEKIKQEYGQEQQVELMILKVKKEFDSKKDTRKNKKQRQLQGSGI